MTAGERKHVTVLFADMRNSMELLAARDPEEARTLLDPVLDCMMAAVHQYDGLVNQVMGDGIMALFGAPFALEDHAVRAAYAALRMQEGVRIYAVQLPKALGAAVSIRIGLNSGEVLVRSIGSDLHMDYTALGQTTHLASRMEQAARPGSILVTAATARLVEGYVTLDPLGSLRVKGLETPVEVSEIVGAGQVRSRLQAAVARGLTPFVGRTREMDQLIGAVEEARAGRGQVIALAGEVGVGKSRLLWEFLHSDYTKGCRILEGQSASYAKEISYAPIIDLLRKYFDVREQEEPREIRLRVTNQLLAFGSSLGPVVPAFLALLDIPVDDPDWTGLDPSRRRTRTIEGFRHLLTLEGQRQPVVLSFEDLHWADSETCAVLDAIVDAVPQTRILVLVSYRPEFNDHPWRGKSSYACLNIDPFQREAVETLLSVLLGDDSNLGVLKKALGERTAGNPLFLEETLKNLVETQVLTGARGAYRLARPLPTIHIPPSLNALLAARIDRLSTEDKRVLQAAAVIGKDVPAGLLESIADVSEEDLQRSVARLQAGEFIFQTSLFPDREYTFKHALTHEVAYGSLLRERRRLLHGRIVDVVTSLHRGRLPEHIERLAYHAQKSERWPEAVAYCRQAGGKAVARSANREAVAYFDQALEAFRHLRDDTKTVEHAFDIRLDLRSALVPLGDFPRVFQVLHELESLGQQLGDRRRQGLVSALMTGAYFAMGQPGLAAECGERSKSIATTLGDTTIEILACTYLGPSYFFLGDYGRSIDCNERVVSLLPRERCHENFGVAIRPGVFARGNLSWSFAELGHFAAAESSAREALELAETIEHPQTLAAGLLAMGTFYVKRGDVANAVTPFERARDLCQRHDIPLWKPVFASFLGYSLALSARFDEAEILLREALEQAALMRLGVFYSQMIMWLSEARLQSGAVRQAGELAEEALRSTQERREQGLEAWALRLMAEVTTQREPLDIARAEDLYQRAMQQAEALGMRPLIARSHLGLGVLYRRARKHHDAKPHLVTAASLFRDMGMRFWPESVETELHMLVS